MGYPKLGYTTGKQLQVHQQIPPKTLNDLPLPYSSMMFFSEVQYLQ